MSKYLFGCLFAFSLCFCGQAHSAGREEGPTSPASAFDDDVAFLKKYGDVIVLKTRAGQSRVAVMPTLQGRVMTSTAGSPSQLSYGWINRPLFEAGEISPHTNAFGGEERIWLGPEGGQYSIFFAGGSEFTRANWYTPKLIDVDTWAVAAQTEQSVLFTKEATLTNYSGATFQIKINREVRVLDNPTALSAIGAPDDSRLTSVTYQTVNELHNTGKEPWDRKTGLLMIWLLGRFNPSPDTTVIVPFEAGSVEHLGPVVDDDYYSKVPADRLKVVDGTVFFRGDGAHRSKIGMTAQRAKGVMGSFDASNRTLTIIKYTMGLPGDLYVNQKWEIQESPYTGGDVMNAYNGGPSATGAKTVAPFYELESSSPARELKPGESMRYIQTTSHFQGDGQALDALSKATLGVSLKQITEAFGEYKLPKTPLPH